MIDQIQPDFNELFIYNIVLLLAYLWFLKKYLSNSFALLLITLFFGGLFMDFGNQLIGKIIFGTIKRSTIGTGIWQFITFIWTLYFYNKSKNQKNYYNNKTIKIAFYVYISYFIISTLFINHDSFGLIISELHKDVIPFLMFFVIARKMQNSSIAINLKLLFYRLLNAQIIFSIAKILILMRPYEGLVGSLTGIANGGPGTTLPLLGLIFIGINSKMDLKIKDIWLIIGLLLTGFLAGKRAVWLLFPILYLLLSLYVYRKRIIKKIIFATFFVVFFIYIGIRLMPSLNPDNEVWGSFDPEYAWNYGQKYSMGKENASDEIEEGTGRVGALVLAYNQITSDLPENSLFGYGISYLVVSQDNYYDSSHWWGIDHRGSITGILYKYFSIGLFGAIIYTILITLIISNVNNKKLKLVIILLVLFDFIFYNATIVNFPSLFTLLFFEMFFSTDEIKNNKNNIYKKL